MTPYYADPWLTVYEGDCRAVLASLPAESVHTVVTSPPYWGLRDYGTATWSGGDPACDHVERNARNDVTAEALARRADAYGTGTGSGSQVQPMRFKGACGKCGATRVDSQLGLEPTPEEYVANTVAVFREVRRVLRADGTLWLNLGDTFFGGAGSSEKRRKDSAGVERPRLAQTCERCGAEFEGTAKRRFCSAFCGGVDNSRRGGRAPYFLKPKDLVGIPWRVAFALQADGWYLRSDIIWSKPNPMPESVTDRPTKAHEYLFLLSKSARYYYDADAVREPNEPSTIERHSRPVERPHFDARQAGIHGHRRHEGSLNVNGGLDGRPAGRNLRSVWTVATQPYPGAHFATFPPKLVEPAIKAGTSERGVCPECGAPWERVVEREVERRHSGGGSPSHAALKGYSATSVMRTNALPVITTTGWRPTCRHITPDGERVVERPDGTTAVAPTWSDAIATVPARVLDPFAGSGTTGMVAQSLSRRAVLIDLNGEYLTQAMARNRDIPLGLDVA